MWHWMIKTKALLFLVRVISGMELVSAIGANATYDFADHFYYATSFAELPLFQYNNGRVRFSSLLIISLLNQLKF